MASVERPIQTKSRQPLIAALLTILTPGLGQLYVGRPRRAISVLLGLWAAAALWAFLSMRILSPLIRLSSFALLPCVWLGILSDAVQLARRSPAVYPLRPYNRGLVYAAVVLLMAFVLQPLFTSTVKAGIARAYTFPGEMMSPTLRAGDYLYAFPYAPAQVHRGDLVVWRDSNGGEFIQRALGIPSDTIEMRSKVLHINGEAISEPYVQHVDPEADPADTLMLWQQEVLRSPDPAYSPSRDNWGPLVIPSERYLLLGDNRDNSFDGRYRGLVDQQSIVGRPVWVYFSRDPATGRIRWNRIGKSIQ